MDKSLVHGITHLPHKILNHHFLSELPQLVLHELGHDNCFGLKRAVYLIDNPDFDHLLGVAGYCCDECKHHSEDMWAKPEGFGEDMGEASFHNDMKKFLRTSFKRRDVDLHKSGDIKELGSLMGIEVPKFFLWNMKHGNHGLLIFDEGKEICPWRKQMLQNASALLSLCGISGT
jgi:hypothetical protein